MKKIKLFSIFLIILLLAQLITPCFATDATETAPEESSVTEEIPQIPEDAPVKLTDYSFEVDYEARAKAAVLVELSTHTIVYGQELDRKLYPASLTKIMTCMLALEHGDPEDIVTVSATALENLSIYGSTANLLEGEELTLEELLYCIMISSANEGCNVIAEHISGSVSEFVELMNEKAKELGMNSTQYKNTHGLHNDEHYTTVRDLAVLSCWAWENDEFRKYATTTSHTVPATNLSAERELKTTNYLTSSDVVQKYYYSKASGIKTGFTTPAGGCLVSTASDGELTYLCIVCGCETLIEADGGDLDMRFVESERLFEYGFENYSFVQVLSTTEMLDQPSVSNAEGRSNVVVHADTDASVILPNSFTAAQIIMKTKYDSMQLTAPLDAGQRVGTVTATYKGIDLATADLVTLTAVESIVKETEPEILEDPTVQSGEVAEEESASLLDYWFVTIPLIILLIIVILLIIIRAYNTHQAKQRAKRRREREARRRNRYGQ